MRPLHVVVLVMGLAKCGRGAPASPARAASPAISAVAASSTSTAAPRAVRDEPVGELWSRAEDGEADDLARLAQREGATGLVDAARGRKRMPVVALRALAFAEGLSALPYLAEAASGADEKEADAALESLAAIAARPRVAVDPEDAVEMKEGCDALLALARDAARPRGRRAAAVRFLRMMSDRGCARAADVPTDVDVPPRAP